MSARWLCERCEDTGRVEQYAASDPFHPLPYDAICEHCPRCIECTDLISAHPAAAVHFDAEEGDWYCSECREPTPIERAAELTRTIMAQMAAS